MKNMNKSEQPTKNNLAREISALIKSVSDEHGVEPVEVLKKSPYNKKVNVVKARNKCVYKTSILYKLTHGEIAQIFNLETKNTGRIIRAEMNRLSYLKKALNN